MPLTALEDKAKDGGSLYRNKVSTRMIPCLEKIFGTNFQSHSELLLLKDNLWLSEFKEKCHIGDRCKFNFASPSEWHSKSFRLSRLINQRSASNERANNKSRRKFIALFCKR